MGHLSFHSYIFTNLKTGPLFCWASFPCSVVTRYLSPQTDFGHPYFLLYLSDSPSPFHYPSLPNLKKWLVLVSDHFSRLLWPVLFPAPFDNCSQSCQVNSSPVGVWTLSLVDVLCTFSWHLFVPAFKSLAKMLNKTRPDPALWGSALSPPLPSLELFLGIYIIILHFWSLSQLLSPCDHIVIQNNLNWP